MFASLGRKILGPFLLIGGLAFLIRGVVEKIDAKPSSGLLAFGVGWLGFGVSSTYLAYRKGRVEPSIR